MNDFPSHEVERLVAQQLSNLPARRAPATLQSRVWRELERGAQRPWWHKSFWHWPLAARAVLVVLCLGMAGATVAVLSDVGATRSGTQLSGVLGNAFNWAQSLATVIQGLQSFIGLLLRHAPSTWLYGGAMTLAMLYATLLLVSTAAYRTLVVNR